MSDLEQKSTAAMDTDQHGLKKHDVKVSTVVFMIFCLCAAGAYGIEEMIPESGPGLTLIMLIVLPFIWSTPLGLVASELGSARPQEGGYYKWVQEALGEYWGFQAGWWRTISIYIDNTLYVILAGGYIAGTWDIGPVWEMVIKIAMILIFTYINIRGVRDVGIVSTILSLLVIVAFAMVAICGFLNWEQNPFEPITGDGAWGTMGFSGVAFADWIYYIGMGIALGMWMYSGYESMSTIAGEVKNPQVIPKATMITVPLIMAVYILPTMGGLATLTMEKVTEALGANAPSAIAEMAEYWEVGKEGVQPWMFWGTEVGTVGYADVVTTNWGPAFGLFFIVVAVLAQCSIYNTYIASGSRGFFALADDYLAPPILVKCDKKHGVPYIAVLTVAITNIILCQFAFTTVVVVDVFLLVSAYVMIFISALILRKRIPREQMPFRIPGGYGFLLLICIMPCIIAFIAFFINGTDYFIGGMLGIVSGPVLYYIWKRMYGGLAKKDPVKYPINPKTKLAVGDLKRMAFNFIILAGFGALGVPWLGWFEGGWGPDYYIETYGSGFFADFDGMVNVIKIAAIVFAIVAVILFLLAMALEPKKQKSA
ncbi:MAG: APC family permease [Eubacteriales bacterium]|nr:APC family permease [Eubacteriales bacterium]